MNRTDLLAQVHQDSLMQKTEQLLQEIPRKIIILNDILELPQLNEGHLQDVLNEANICPLESARMTTGSRVCENGPIPCNKALIEVIQTVKPHINQLIKDSNLLKTWVFSLIPKIEDGNNFGVSVQEKVLAYIHSVESEVTSLLDKTTEYYRSRALVISKITKYPFIEDLKQQVRELDEKGYVDMRFVLGEIRNSYLILHDIICKNLEKIMNPRSTSSESLY